MKKKIKIKTFIESLNDLLELTKNSSEIQIKQIFEYLSGRGSAALLVIFSLPFCLPVQIPGFSTPFGIVLSFLGIRMAFGQRPWWPNWILNKSLPSQKVNTFVAKSISILQNKYLKKVLKNRLTYFTQDPLMHRAHGVVIFLLAILLSLPLPIPMSNMLAATPILCFGLGILEDDGLFILIGYILALVCFAAFLGLFFLGKSFLHF